MSPMISRPLSIELALLGYLRNNPLHGYQIYQCLQQPGGLGQVWRVKQALVYAHLSKLEEAGFIQGALQAQEARPPRRVYQLTSAGQDAFLTWLVTPIHTPRQMRQEFLAKLYFAQLENEEVVTVLVDNQLVVFQRWLERHQKQSESVPADRFNQIVYQYRLGQIQATMAWLLQLKPDAS